MGLATFLLGFLRIAFVPPRGLAAAYVPLAGLWAFAAGVLVGGRKYIVERFGGGQRVRLTAQAVTFLRDSGRVRMGASKEL